MLQIYKIFSVYCRQVNIAPLFISFNDVSVNELQYLSLNKSDLTLTSRSTAFYYNQDNAGYYEPYKDISDVHTDKKYILSTSIDTNGTTHKLLAKADSSVILSVFTPKTNTTSEPLIINNTILTYTKNLNWMDANPTFLRKYNLSGQIINERIFTDNMTESDYFAPYLNFLDPIYVKEKNLLAFSMSLGFELFLVDYTTFNLVDELDASRDSIFSPLLNDYGYMTNYNHNFFPEEDGVSFGGTVSIMEVDSVSGFPTGNNFKSLYFKYFWDGSYETKIFGPTGIDNSSYAYDYNQNTKKRGLVSSLPLKRSGGFTNAVEREIMIHVWDENNRDSITILGWGNHVAFQLKLDDKGDVYFAGSHSDAWTTDSQYYFIAKIPEFAVSVMEKQQVEKRLHLYPNPTTRFLNFSDYEELRNKEYLIYSQTGALVKQGRVNGVQVNINDLSPGSYIIVVKDDQTGERFNSVFIKK